MNRLISLIICATTLSLISCRDLPQNGDFSGYWQITAIDYPDGTSLTTDHFHFYGFYRTVAELLGGHTLTYPDMGYYGEKSGNLTYSGDSFVIEFPRFEPSWECIQWGFPPLPEGEVFHQPVYAYYTINHLDSDALVMTLDHVTDATTTYPAHTTITCRRY